MHYIGATLLSANVVSYASIVIAIGLVGGSPFLSRCDGNNESQTSNNSTDAIGDSDTELSLLFLIHRHGDRSPVSFAPKDPHADDADEIWPKGLGMLTNSGKDRMFRLGEYLRRHYADFLGTPDPRQVYTVGSGVDRCIESAQLVLAGLYPPVEDFVWNNKLQWQPIAVFINDTMLNPSADCPTRVDDFMRELTSEDAKEKVLQVTDNARNLTEKIKSEYGLPFDNTYEYAYLTSTLHIEREYNLSLPEWVLDNFDSLDKLSYYGELGFTATDRLKRLFAGLTINDIVAKMNEYRTQRDGDADDDEQWEFDYKLFHYSAHDLNVQAILSTLGVYLDQVPELPKFGASILIELHRSKQRPDYSVKLFYLGRTREEDDSLRELTLTNCLNDGDDTCTLDGFANYTKTYRLNENDWYELCNTTST